MLKRLIGFSLILIGIAGLILPIVPGILMIGIGLLLLQGQSYIGIDWRWVKKQVLKSEKINTDNNDERANNIRIALDGCIRKARLICLPKYIFADKKIIEFKNDSILLEGGISFYTKKITSYIHGASNIVLFAVTIGEGLEAEAGKLTSDKDPLNGYLLDRIGSFAVESMAENMERKLRKDYSLKKKSVSSRFSPGYCDWPIEDQFNAAKIIDLSKVGIRLTEGCMMVPKKSITAIVAIADEGVFKEYVTSCDICDTKECSYRRGA